MSKVIFITGATSGIGEAIATFLHTKGYKVYGTGRNPAPIHEVGYSLVKLDINNQKTIDEAVGSIIQKEGRIDAIINNAGIGLAGPFEEISTDDALEVMDTNVLGILRTSKAVLPIMRKQKSGKIINIGSIGGITGLPFRSFYCASKYATEGLSESLSMEVKQFGISVSLIQSGDMKTKINLNRKELELESNSDYSVSYEKVRKEINDSVDKSQDPIKIAKVIHKILQSKRPKFRYRIGLPLEHFTIFVKNLVPYRLYEYLVNNHYKIN